MKKASNFKICPNQINLHQGLRDFTSFMCLHSIKMSFIKRYTMDKYLQHLRIWSNKLFFQNVPITIHDKLPTKAGTVVVVIVWYLDLHLHVQSVPITTKFVSSNPIHGEVYLIQHYVIKFVSDLRQVGGFSPSTPVFFTNKTDRHIITEILLKVALNTITPITKKPN